MRHKPYLLWYCDMMDELSWAVIDWFCAFSAPNHSIVWLQSIHQSLRHQWISDVEPASRISIAKFTPIITPRLIRMSPIFFAIEVQFIQTQPMHINEQTVVSFWSRWKWGLVLNYVLQMPFDKLENVCRLMVLHNFLQDTFGSKLICLEVIHCWCIEFCVVEWQRVSVRTLSTMCDHILCLASKSQGGCGPVVRLLGCHAGGQHSVPHNRESGISCGAALVDINYTWSRVLQTWRCGPTAILTQW